MAASGTPRPKTDSRHLRTLLAEGRLPECWIPPAHVLEYRALLETYHDLRRERTAWAQRIHAVLFHQGAPQLGDGALRSEQGLAALREASAACLSPAGQLQIAIALDMIAALEARLDMLRKQLLAAVRHLTGAKVLATRLYGVGPVTGLALTCWLGGTGRFSSSRKAVRFAGLDVTVWVDDVQDLRSRDALRQFELLIMRAPAELRFVIATRMTCSWGCTGCVWRGS